MACRRSPPPTGYGVRRAGPLIIPSQTGEARTEAGVIRSRTGLEASLSRLGDLCSVAAVWRGERYPLAFAGDEQIRREPPGFSGQLIKTTGDGFLIESSSVVDVLRCVTEIQAHMAEQNATVPMDKRIEFQIGINVGDIVVEDGDIYSDCELRISQLTIPAKSGISTVLANAEKFMGIKAHAVATKSRFSGKADFVIAVTP